MQNITIGIDGMHCASCSSKVEKTLNSLEGVHKAHVNLPLEEASIEYDPKLTDLHTFSAAIDKLGFKVRELPSPEQETDAPDPYVQAQKTALLKMLIAWVFTIAVMGLMLPHMLLGKMLIPSHILHIWTMTILSLLTMFIPAYGVYVSAWKSVRSGSANMDVLIALGTLAAVVTGPLSLLIKLEDFSAIAAMIIAFHLTGRYLESRAKGKASSAIRALMNLGAKTAILLKGDAEYEIATYKILLDDLLVVKPGSKIPTDGIVVEGISGVDESMATGEAMPVIRKEGDAVIGATLNTDGRLVIKATKIGKDTFLAQIVKLVQEAQHSKVPIQVLADKITGVFVPIVLLMSALTFLSWIFFYDQLSSVSMLLTDYLPWAAVMDDKLAAAIMATIAVLVIACPCALGLATPTALMVGSGIGASKGVLIRNGEALQRMKDIKVMVFDKTGTLTYGKPEVIKILPYEFAETELLRLGYSLEKGSEHPIAKAIVKAATIQKQHPLPAKNFKAIPGKGITATLDGKHYYMGSAEYLKEQGIELKQAITTLPLQEFSHATQIWLADQSSVLGCFLAADSIKPEAISVVKELKLMGIQSVMLSGDNVNAANAIAKQCGIERVLANVLPEDKAIQIRNLQSQIGPVAMVGDGINDAPALKQADIGIAMGQGADIAMEAADITIVRSELTSLLTAISLSKETFRKIRQNLFWAFFYNLIAIPLAILGLLHPIIAEIAMATSSITVVTNANMLRNKRF